MRSIKIVWLSQCSSSEMAVGSGTGVCICFGFVVVCDFLFRSETPDIAEDNFNENVTVVVVSVRRSEHRCTDAFSHCSGNWEPFYERDKPSRHAYIVIW